MSFEDRLARLGAPRLASEAPGAAGSEAAGDKLAELRLKMAAILGRESPPERPERSAYVGAALAELGFVDEPFAEGVVCRRQQRLTASHHVGRMPVDSARDAAAEVLAVLALDPSLASLNLRGALFLDTETTGLGAGGVIAFLVGIAWFDDEGRLNVEQLLLRSPAEESAMLELLRERVERASVFVTFNGKTFDLPVLAARYVMNRLPKLPERPHLDLLHIARRLHKLRVGTCKLTSLEGEVLGFERGEDIAGADVAPRYAHFLRTGDERALSAVVEHNAWDVVSMAALVGLYGEPLTALHPLDLVGLARTFRRAGSVERAFEAADLAVRQGAGPDALRMRGEVSKARGDRVRALQDFEELNQTVDHPAVRLELAKLYEHYVKEPLRALELVERGTGESEVGVERRRARLERKHAQAAQKPAKRARERRA